MENDKYLNYLIEKTLISTNLTTSTVIPINGNVQDLFTIANFLQFEDYQLEKNNPISIVPADKSLEDLIGSKVIATDEKKE